MRGLKCVDEEITERKRNKCFGEECGVNVHYLLG